ncbi:PD-(D/E)XK motif protein [Microbulbifer sp. EKSA005]|uniref:PD-(D/E)XK motif protein n=1 Tax=Microbulbifer sp. EKSA005 TaxID=3243364 RepID=UPI004043049E
MNTDLETVTERWQDLVREEPGEYNAARYRVGGTPSFGVFLLSRYPDRTPAIELGPIRPDITKSAPLPSMKGIESAVVADGGQFYLAMDLKQFGATSVFLVLAARLCEDLQDISHPITAYGVINEVLSCWKSFFATDRKHLGEQSQTGLYGELLLILMLFNNGIPVRKLLKAWRGSDGAHQDFQFPGVSAEVKSTVAITTDKVSISSLRQLENVGAGDLYLIQVVLDLHEGGNNTLPFIVSDLREAFSANSVDQLMFEEKLLTYGYRDEDNSHYSGRSYTLRKVRVFQVDTEFPKLTSFDVVGGVVEASYVISLTGVMEASLDLEAFVDRLQECIDE